MDSLELECEVQNCKKCQCQERKYYPVHSFGQLNGKLIWVVGINPSSAEYEAKFGSKPYLSQSTEIDERRKDQLTYFCKEPYTFFKKIESFFQEEVQKQVVAWKVKPWEKVGYVDLVKCVTETPKGQWGTLQDRKSIFILNCQDYLKRQLIIYKPRLIITSGADVRSWFCWNSNYQGTAPEYATAMITMKDNSWNGAVSFLNQRHGPLNINAIRQSIISAFKLLNCPIF